MKSIRRLECSFMPHISTNISQICKKVCDENPEIIEYKPISGSEFSKQRGEIKGICVDEFPEVGECSKAVFIMQNIYGGSCVFGWKISQLSNLFIQCNAYMMWKKEDGTVVDVTPDTYIDSQTLFLPDESITSVEVAPKLFTITKSIYANELVEIVQEMFGYLKYAKHPELLTNEERQRLFYLKKRKDEIIEIVSRNVGRNDKCPCCSGIKYKKCCGSF